MNRNEEKEKNNKKKRSKNYLKRKNQKQLGRMVEQVHNFDPKLLPEGSAKLRCDGRGGARSAPIGVEMSLKRRVRAAHGRAPAAKSH